MDNITPPPMPEPALAGSIGTCCGNYTTGGSYMGQTEELCCGRPDEAWPDYFTADQLAARDQQWLAIVTEAVERERAECAKVCEQSDEEGEGPDCWGWHAKDFAAAIRSRSNHG